MDNVLPFRLLCQINENLHHAVNDLRSLCAGISVPGNRLNRMVTMIEESRAVVNRTLAECIEMRDSVRAGEWDEPRKSTENEPRRRPPPDQPPVESFSATETLLWIKVLATFIQLLHCSSVGADPR